jgi:RNA polymerase sigma-70 factor (ECF subfamily)
MAPQLRIVDFRPSAPADDPALDLDGLFRTYSRYVASLTFRITGNAADAEDLVQETFLDAQKGLRGLRDSASVKAWLATVAIRKSKRHLVRRRFMRILGIEKDIDCSTVADHGASPEQSAQVASIYRILDGIAPNKRIAWVLRYVEGESMNNITAALKCSRATAHRWIAEVQDVIEEVLRDEY